MVTVGIKSILINVKTFSIKGLILFTYSWFDKSLSLVFNKDGSVSVSFEHSWGDGVAVLRYFNELYTDTRKSPFVHPHTKPADKMDIQRVVRPIGKCRLQQ